MPKGPTNTTADLLMFHLCCQWCLALDLSCYIKHSELNPCCEAIRELLYEHIMCKCLHTSERTMPLLSDQVRQWGFDCGGKIASGIERTQEFEIKVTKDLSAEACMCGSGLWSGGISKSLFSCWRNGCSGDTQRLRLYLMDLLSSSSCERCQSSTRTNSCTHLIASKVAAWCLTELHMSLVVPVSSSLSCQADLRWQTCVDCCRTQGEVSSARCFSCMDTQFNVSSFF